MAERRTQAQRRAETRAAILKSATEIFGEHGYSNTSLNEIADACDISIAPIYHYFKNKKNLFAAVNAKLEKQILDDGQTKASGFDAITHSWQNFLQLCQDPKFRQIVLIDAPNVLGRESMYSSPVSKAAIARIKARTQESTSDSYKAEILSRMLMGALAEAGLFVGNCENPEQASRDAADIVTDLITKLK